MVYQRRYSSGGSSTPPASNPGSNPGNNSESEEKRSAAPMMWAGGENFDVGTLNLAGGYLFTGENLVDVDDMTPEQLVTASKELHRELKRELIEKRELELMEKIATNASTSTEYHDRFAEEPFLMLRETPPGDPLLGDDFDTIEKIRAKIAEWLIELDLKLATKEALRLHIGTLGGPVIPSPVGTCQELSEVDKVKEKVGEIEKHLVPTPGTPPEDVENDYTTPPIPAVPTIPTSPHLRNLDTAWVKLEELQIYLSNLREYYKEVLFSMGWAIEGINVCLRELKVAKAPGTQSENYKAAFEAVARISTELEVGGVFHD